MIKILSLMLLVFACLISTSLIGDDQVWAQDARGRDWNDTYDPLKGGVGIHYGKLGGHGLAFRYPLKWFLYGQVAGGIWHADERRRHNLGTQLNYLLRQDERMRVYLAAGLGYFYDREMTEIVDGLENWQTSENWNSGIGVGIEILQGKRWSYQVELDFVRESDSQDIKVTPQFGLYFYW